MKEYTKMTKAEKKRILVLEAGGATYEEAEAIVSGRVKVRITRESETKKKK